MKQLTAWLRKHKIIVLVTTVVLIAVVLFLSVMYPKFVYDAKKSRSEKLIAETMQALSSEDEVLINKRNDGCDTSSKEGRSETICAAAGTKFYKTADKAKAAAAITTADARFQSLGWKLQDGADLELKDANVPIWKAVYKDPYDQKVSLYVSFISTADTAAAETSEIKLGEGEYAYGINAFSFYDVRTK